MNKTKDILEFSGKQEDIDEIHDEMIDKLIEYEKEKCNKKVEELEKKKRNPNPIDKEEINNIKAKKIRKKLCDDIYGSA